MSFRTSLSGIPDIFFLPGQITERNSPSLIIASMLRSLLLRSIAASYRRRSLSGLGSDLDLDGVRPAGGSSFGIHNEYLTTHNRYRVAIAGLVLIFSHAKIFADHRKIFKTFVPQVAPPTNSAPA